MVGPWLCPQSVAIAASNPHPEPMARGAAKGRPGHSAGQPAIRRRSSGNASARLTGSQPDVKIGRRLPFSAVRAPERRELPWVSRGSVAPGGRTCRGREGADRSDRAAEHSLPRERRGLSAATVGVVNLPGCWGQLLRDQQRDQADGGEQDAADDDQRFGAHVASRPPVVGTCGPSRAVQRCRRITLDGERRSVKAGRHPRPRAV